MTDLEEFINTGIEVTVEVTGNYPTGFMLAWEKHKWLGHAGLVITISELTRRATSGFEKVADYPELLPWCLESAVVKFPDYFPPDVVRNCEGRVELLKRIIAENAKK